MCVGINVAGATELDAILFAAIETGEFVEAVGIGRGGAQFCRVPAIFKKLDFNPFKRTLIRILTTIVVGIFPG